MSGFLEHSARNRPNSRLRVLSDSFYVLEPPFKSVLQNLEKLWFWWGRPIFKDRFLIRKTDLSRPIFDKEQRFLRLIIDKEDQFFDKEDRNPVSINHQETAQIAAKHSEETSRIPDCSFYLAVLMSRDATVQ